MAARMRRVLQAAAVAVVALLIVLLAFKVFDEARAQSLRDAVRSGEKPAAPSFDLPRLNGGGSLALESLRGKAVVLNFWASWCEPCKEEAPLLEQAWKRYRDEGVVLVGIDANDFRKDARRFVERYRTTYEIVHDGRGATLGRFGLTGFPETLFLDAKGRIVDWVVGPVTEETLARGIAAAREAS